MIDFFTKEIREYCVKIKNEQRLTAFTAITNHLRAMMVNGGDEINTPYSQELLAEYLHHYGLSSVLWVKGSKLVISRAPIFKEAVYEGHE